MGYIDTDSSKRVNRKYVKKAMSTPLLDQERELELARRWRDNGDEAALHELTTAYLRLVISMAGRFRHYGLPMNDLVQEGNVGLMQAAARFEPSRAVRFSTYASWWIRAAIQDHVLRNWSIVRTGTTAAQKSLFFNLRRLRGKAIESGATQMTSEAVDKIAKTLGVRREDVELMDARLSAADRSLNAPVGEAVDALEWQDLLADERPLPEEVAIDRRDSEIQTAWLAKAMRTLSDREILIIKERKLRDDTVTLEALGTRLGISKERVRQIEHQALRKLKSALVHEAGHLDWTTDRSE